ncbi:MAG: HmuY family protein [Chitinophagales bacterium]|jgi:hypothetical protein|nr:HmuY family protein [Chitinophagales bacterium]
MKQFSLFLFSIAMMTIMSCEKTEIKNFNSDKKTETDLFARVWDSRTFQPKDSGEFVRYSFAKKAIVTDSTWDIAFRNDKIILNGGQAVTTLNEPKRTGLAGSYFVDSTFDEVKSVNSSKTFKQDALGSYGIETWYNYNSTTRVATPKAGRIYLIKTHDAKYVKMEILSYYKGNPNPATLTSRDTTYGHYTFIFQTTN